MYIISVETFRKDALHLEDFTAFQGEHKDRAIELEQEMDVPREIDL